MQGRNYAVISAQSMGVLKLKHLHSWYTASLADNCFFVAQFLASVWNKPGEWLDAKGCLL